MDNANRLSVWKRGRHQRIYYRQVYLDDEVATFFEEADSPLGWRLRIRLNARDIAQVWYQPSGHLRSGLSGWHVQALTLAAHRHAVDITQEVCRYIHTQGINIERARLQDIEALAEPARSNHIGEKVLPDM